jgi:glycosyltransferase involved in cell wall biosynthesis
MERVKVAFDITVLGDRFSSADPRHGIYNVVEHLVKELCERDDVDMTALGLCGDDPLSSALKASLYLEHQNPQLACSFQNTFKMTPGLASLYTAVFRATLAGALDKMSPSSPRRALLRALRSMLYRMAYLYRLFPPQHIFDYKAFDVFHSPHIELPARTVTGDLPRVVTVYDIIPAIKDDFVSSYYAAFFKSKLAQIDVDHDWVVCISEFTRQEFCAYTGMSPDRCLVAPLAAAQSLRPVTDPAAFTATRTRYGIPEGEYFLSLAAPQPRKNLAHLIRCFYRLIEQQQLPDTFLVLAGSKEQGWMYDEIFETAEASSRHRPQLIFTGYVADEDLSALYSGALAFVFPSLYEGFGLPPLEAMQCGTPVIVSNTTSLPEVVGEAGLMVDPRDEEELCQAMLRIGREVGLRSELGRRGVDRAAKFSWEKCAEETVKVYHAAAGDRF